MVDLQTIKMVLGGLAFKRSRGKDAPNIAKKQPKKEKLERLRSVTTIPTSRYGLLLVTINYKKFKTEARERAQTPTHDSCKGGQDGVGHVHLGAIALDGENQGSRKLMAARGPSPEKKKAQNSVGSRFKSPAHLIKGTCGNSFKETVKILITEARVTPCAGTKG